MLVILTTGVNFINVPNAAFAPADLCWQAVFIGKKRSVKDLVLCTSGALSYLVDETELQHCSMYVL
jgi:hypothetical protein